ncbi:MAG TPA: GNAT family N-acetyltransferase [Solirubrobacterales bacterium]|nr:GNAT family N-acetyltransferase [Solirubrobacterales bacterium]
MEIRAATEGDVQLIFDLICELATYEKLRDEVVGTPELLRASLFDRGDAEALIVEAAGEAVGYAIFYTTFSTFECRSGIWLEDIYVRPEHRQAGIGLRVMEHLAGLALERGHVRLEWCALEWNEPALSFYAKLGARRLDDWRMLRLEAEGMQELAAGASQ